MVQNTNSKYSIAAVKHIVGGVVPFVEGIAPLVGTSVSAIISIIKQILYTLRHDPLIIILLATVVYIVRKIVSSKLIKSNKKHSTNSKSKSKSSSSSESKCDSCVESIFPSSCTTV